MYALVDRCAWGMDLETMEAGASKHMERLFFCTLNVACVELYDMALCYKTGRTWKCESHRYYFNVRIKGGCWSLDSDCINPDIAIVCCLA